MKKAAALALAAALACQPLFAAGAGAPTPQPLDQRVRESERKQQMIRTQTQRIGDELGSIITEFENNGMGQGEDVKVLRAIKSVLGNLSDKDMARVIELLGSARGGDAGQTKARVAQAFGGQKTIVVELRQLLLEYDRQQQLYELSLRFAQLAGRQNGNLKEAKRLVRSANGRSLDRFDEGQKISLSVQKDEQTAIRDESLAVINKLAALAKDTDSSIAERLNDSLKAAKKGRLEDSLKNSVEELKAGNLYRAAGSQKAARDQLRELSRLVAPPKDTVEILRQAAAELERLVIEQRNTIAVTQNLPSDRSRTSDEAYFDAEDKQGDVVDRTDMVQRDIEHLVPLASEQLKKGEDRMQEARSQILEKKRTDATKSEEQAAVALETARKLVLEELNKQEKKDEQPVDKLAAAKELKDKIAKLKEDQQKLKEQTAKQKDPKKAAALSPEQAKLQQQARELQPNAAQESTPAADALADAAKEMGKAQASLEKKERLDQVTAPQQAAVDNLTRAEKMLDKEIADLEQAKSDLADLEQSREKVAELIKNQNKIELATAQAEAQTKDKDNASKPDKSADPKAIAQEQSKNASATDQAAAGLPKAGADAAQPLQAAKSDMQQAHQDLSKGDPEGARPDEKQASANLEKAKDAIDRKIGELRQQLGQPDSAQAAATADLAQAIEKAQNEIAQTMKEGDGSAQPQQVDQSKQSQQSPSGQQPKDAQANGDKPQGKQDGQQKGQPQQAQSDQPGDQAKSQGKPAAKQAESFQKTAQDLASAAADASAPAAVDQAISQATDALAQAAGAAKAGDQPSAQANAAGAQAALAQAAAALAMAKQGASSNAQANAQQGQGQGQQPGQQGQGQAPSQTEGKGEGQMEGQGQKGQQQAKGQGIGKGQAPSQSNAEGQGESSGERMSGHAAAADSGDRANARGKGEFIKLPPRDRNAIMQSRKESAPSEYAPAVEQYLRNLSDSEDK
jgi:hypothetical protein